MDRQQTSDHLARIHEYERSVIQTTDCPILPSLKTLQISADKLQSHLPENGVGLEEITRHLIDDVSPGLNRSSISSRYYGFVTGGVTPAARLGESLTATYDQSPQVHLPDQTIATLVEHRALQLLLDLLDLQREAWSGIFTTGATAGNILGLALGREHTINQAIERKGGNHKNDATVGSVGLLQACRMAGVENLMIFATRAHSSLTKAASILGFGRSNVIDVGCGKDGMQFDLEKVETMIIEHCQTHAFIIAVSCGEVNTGLFATQGTESMHDLRILCDRYHAWLHVDGAFGLFARLLDGTSGYENLARGAQGVELADSIAGDGHKMLNVPYDCGFFLHRSGSNVAEEVFQNANAVYLTTSQAGNDNVRSLLNVGLENSRRFRALPVYASLVAYGRTGYQEMLMRQIGLAREIATFICHHQAYELLPPSIGNDKDQINHHIFIVVLFRAKDENLNSELVTKINHLSKIYVSGTKWDGKPASRFAIANWQADIGRDLPVVKEVLNAVSAT